MLIIVLSIIAFAVVGALVILGVLVIYYRWQEKHGKLEVVTKEDLERCLMEKRTADRKWSA